MESSRAPLELSGLGRAWELGVACGPGAAGGGGGGGGGGATGACADDATAAAGWADGLEVALSTFLELLSNTITAILYIIYTR